MTNSILLHIPHASLDIPERYRADIVLSDEALQRELVSLTDMYTDELYVLPGATRAVFPVSRFLVDAERFSEDAQESMAARGMGVIYTVTTELKKLREAPIASQRQELLEAYYWPHHHSLDAWADKTLSEQGRALLIDCHSFPSQALPYELEAQPRPRPQICIGTDDFHTPLALSNLVVDGFRKLGYEVGLNSPFAGTLTPGSHYGKSHNLQALMIEIRKDLYMNEKTGEKLPSFSLIQAHISEVLLHVAAYMAVPLAA